MYDYQTLTLTNIDGSISPFSNGASGLILLGTGTSTPPAWTSLADAGIATKQYVDDTFLKLTGGTLTGALTGTSASFSGGVTATGGFSGDLTGTASNAEKVANALSIQLGTGTAQSYDGSNPLSVSVTPAAIGAALASHEHSLSDITSGWPNDHGLLFHDTNSTTTPPTILANPTMSTATAGLYFPAQSVGSASREFGWQKMPLGVIISQETTSAGGTVRSLTSAVGSTQNTFLKFTGTGYEFAPIGSAIVPPITSLQSASSDTEAGTPTQNKNQTVLFRAESYTGNPSWRLIDDSDIYGAPQNNLSVLVSDGTGAVDTYGCPGRWHNIATSNISTTPKIFAAKTVSSNPTLDFFSASDLGLVTSIPNIKGLEVGEDSTANKVLLGNASATGTPSWSDSAPKADILTTARTLTIGNTGKTFDGSANVSWSQNEIGFATGESASFSFTGAGWWRIAYTANSATAFNNAIFRVCTNISRSGTYYCNIIFASGYSMTTNINNIKPSIVQLLNSQNSATRITDIRLVYKNSASAYLEICSTGSGDFNIEKIGNGWNFYDAATVGSDESANGYSVYDYQFHDDVGSNGQFLTAVNTTSGSTQTVSRAWTTLTDIPSAPSSLPLVDNETGALGTAGTYANADHQHPLPYSVQAAYKFFYPRKIGIGGAITAEAQEYDGTADLILQVTEIDPNAIINTVPIEKGGTGATTASQALTNLGAAASNHNHDSTYLKLSGGNMTGTINTPANITPLNWAGKSGVATFVSGDLTAQDNVNSYVTGRRQNINLYDSDVSADSASPTTINHTAKNDTTVNIVCGINEVRRYTRYINLPTPTADMLGDTITIYFTNQKPSVIAELFATCSTNYRIKSYDYSNFGNTAGVDANCKWSSGNVVRFTCINLENNGTTYYWRAIKLVEQSW